MAQLPSVLTQYNLYLEGTRGIVGLVDVELPDIEHMTETLTGTGVIGEIDTPIVGAYAAMTATLNFRTPSPDAFRLLDGTKAHNITLRAAIQTEETGTGSTTHKSWVVTMRVKGRTGPLGKAETNTTTDSSIELEVYAVKAVYDGQTVVEIDKLNNVAIIAGVDQLKTLNRILNP